MSDTAAEWPLERLGELCARITVGHVGKMSDQYVDAGVPFFRSQDIRPFGVNLDTCLHVGSEFASSLKKSALRTGDVLVVRTGYPGTAAVMPPHVGEANCADLVVITPNDELDAHYLVSFLNSAAGQGLIQGRLVGAAQQHFNIGEAKNLQIRIPPIHVQRTIGFAVHAFTSLIENNRRRIELLEETARLLYREWFVNFRYPGHEDVALVDSELGPIPQDWEVQRLADACHLTMGQSPKSDYYNEIREGLPFHQGVTDFGLRYPTHSKWCTVDSRIAEEGDILLSVRAPVGRINVAPDRMVIGRGLAAIRSTRVQQALFFEQLKNVFAQEDSMGAGTIYPAVKKADIEEIRLLKPPQELCERLANLVDPPFRLIKRLTDSNRNLSEIRDLLLPRLVSGELDISDLDLDLEAVS